MPSRIGPIEYSATMFASAIDIGSRGPGTFDTTRLIGGRCLSARFRREYIRMNHAKGRGGVISDQSRSISDPSTLWNSFAAFVTLLIARSRSIGSSMSVRRDVNMFETLL